MIISKVHKDSIAEDIGLKIGDRLVSINGNSIDDIIDYRYHASDEYIEIAIDRDEHSFIVDIEKDPDEELGLDFEPVKYRSCGNKCIFCFIDQNPDNLRSNLYFKDEDFRLSFLHGNYVTLTNTTQKDLDRIVAQRLTPLYVSVHATNPTLRSFMLGIKREDKLLEKLDFLIRHHIEIHTQIVLCPGINDGDHLIRTVEDLYQRRPGISSVAIVPVGLTRHRHKLYQLNSISRHHASHTIDTVESLAARFKRESGSHFVHLADEFYILAERDFPLSERYEGFQQYENGVGMMRYFLDEFEKQISDFPAKLKNPTKINLVTAALASTTINSIVIPELNKIKNLSATSTVVRNLFYGDSVTVTGLMTGIDIYDNCSKLTDVDIHLLPGNCLNVDGLTLDDWTIDKLKQKLKTDVQYVNIDYADFLQKLE